MPSDLDQWEADCATIVEAGYACLAHGAKDGWVNEDVFLSLANSVSPGLVYEAIEGDTSWTDPDLVAAMTAWGSLFTNGIVAEGATAMAEYPDAFSAFLEGNAAFVAPGHLEHLADDDRCGHRRGAEGRQHAHRQRLPVGALPRRGVGWGTDESLRRPGQRLGGRGQHAVRGGGPHLPRLPHTLGYGQENQASGGNIPAVRDVAVSTEDVVDPRQVEDIERQQASIDDLVGLRQIPYPDLDAALIDALSQVAAGAATPEAALESVESVSAGLDRE